MIKNFLRKIIPERKKSSDLLIDGHSQFIVSNSFKKESLEKLIKEFEFGLLDILKKHDFMCYATTENNYKTYLQLSSGRKNTIETSKGEVFFISKHIPNQQVILRIFLCEGTDVRRYKIEYFLDEKAQNFQNFLNDMTYYVKKYI